MSDIKESASMVKADALVLLVMEIREDLQRLSQAIDAVINLIDETDKTAGIPAGTDKKQAAKARILGLVKNSVPEYRNLTLEEVERKIGGLKK